MSDIPLYYSEAMLITITTLYIVSIKITTTIKKLQHFLNTSELHHAVTIDHITLSYSYINLYFNEANKLLIIYISALFILIITTYRNNKLFTFEYY